MLIWNQSPLFWQPVFSQQPSRQASLRLPSWPRPLFSPVPSWQAFLQPERSEEHTSELQSLMRISYAVFCLKKKKKQINKTELQKNSTTYVSKTYTDTKTYAANSKHQQ